MGHMAQSTLGPDDLKAYEEIRDGRMTVAMAPMYGGSIRRLIAAGLARRGADGVFHLTTPGVLAGAPPPGFVPAPPPKKQPLVLRAQPELHASLEAQAQREGITKSEAVRRRLAAYDEPSAPLSSLPPAAPKKTKKRRDPRVEAVSPPVEQGDGISGAKKATADHAVSGERKASGTRRG